MIQMLIMLQPHVPIQNLEIVVRFVFRQQDFMYRKKFTMNFVKNLQRTQKLKVRKWT